MEFYSIFLFTVIIYLNESMSAESSQKKISSGTVAVTYTRWGRKYCYGGNKTETVYSGNVGGSRYYNKGAAVDYLCMPEHPEGNVDRLWLTPGYGYLTGASYDYHSLPCAVCRAVEFANVLMIPGKSKCMPSWTKLYSGYLMTGNYKDEAASQYICLDGNAETKRAEIGQKWGKKFSQVGLECGVLPCPPYKSHQAVACVVCSK